MNATEGFEKLQLNVNGTDTVVLALGDAAAPPLVFFHGAGTFHGWEFARPWASSFRVLIPHHPGFGESGDMAGLREFGDFVLHYGTLFDQLGLHHDVNLVGSSLGGRLAARFAIHQQHRLRRLVLVAPAGLNVPQAPMDDLFRIPPDQLVGRLVKNFDVLLPWLPADPHDLDFAVDRYRETRTVATVAWDEPFDRVVPRWMPTMTVPTMLMWGHDDALIPVGQAAAWMDLIPDGSLRLFDDAGHLLLDESLAAVTAVAEFCA
jgi:pimeloyl-ACP methyl ester carboxylesterase